MKYPRSFLLAMLGVLLAPPIGLSDSLRSAGVLGNSGEQGESLVRFGVKPASGMGVIQDRFGSLWDRAGAGVLNRYAVDGRMIASYRVAPSASRTDRDTITLIGDVVLLKIGKKLYTLPVTADAETSPMELSVGANRLSYGTQSGWAAAARDNLVFWVNAAGETREIATLENKVDDIEVGPDGGVYVNSKGLFIRVDTAAAMDERGPWQAPGERPVWLADYWYGSSWHGTIRRFNRELSPDPGVVLGGASGSFIGYVEGNHELDSARGMAHLRGSMFAASGIEGVMHLLDWRPVDQRLVIVRRIGALAECHGLAIDSKGRVWNDNNVWDWSDGPDAPVHNSGPGAEVLFGVTMLPNDMLVGPGIRWGKPAIFAGDMDKPSSIFGGVNELQKTLIASAVIETNKRRMLVVVDRAGQGYAYTIGRNGRPSGSATPVTLQAKTPLKELTSLAALDSTRLVAAADGQVIEFTNESDSWTETKRWREWGEQPDQHFGDKIYLTTADGKIWVSDTGRNRVLGFDGSTPNVLASYGLLDAPRASLDALNAPTFLAVNGGRMVVYDSGNQRIMKLEHTRK